MTAFYLAIFILLLVSLVVTFQLKEKRKLLRQLRENWGKRSENQIQIELAKMLAEFQDETTLGNRYVLDDKTWQDLDFDEIFNIVNRTITPIGGQYLFFLLKTPVLENETLKKREQLISLFSQDQKIREKIQKILTKLTDRNAGYLVRLLWQSLPAKPKYSFQFPLLSTIAVLSLLFVLLQILPWWAVIFIFTFNLVVRQISKRKIDDSIISFRYLSNLINIAHQISGLTSEALHEIQTQLKLNLRKTTKLNRKIISLQLQDGFGISDYINIYFLLDITSFYSALNEIKKHKEALKTILFLPLLMIWT